MPQCRATPRVVPAPELPRDLLMPLLQILCPTLSSVLLPTAPRCWFCQHSPINYLLACASWSLFPGEPILRQTSGASILEKHALEVFRRLERTLEEDIRNDTISKIFKNANKHTHTHFLKTFKSMHRKCKFQIQRRFTFWVGEEVEGKRNGVHRGIQRVFSSADRILFCSLGGRCMDIDFIIHYVFWR